MTINANSYVTLIRVKGNREPIAAQLLDNDGEPVSGGISGHTIVFRMVNMATGVAKVDNQAATIDDAETCEVHYSPAAGDVDTAGNFAAYFLDLTANPNTRFPYDGARFKIQIIEEQAASGGP